MEHTEQKYTKSTKTSIHKTQNTDIRIYTYTYKYKSIYITIQDKRKDTKDTHKDIHAHTNKNTHSYKPNHKQNNTYIPTNPMQTPITPGKNHKHHTQPH